LLFAPRVRRGVLGRGDREAVGALRADDGVAGREAGRGLQQSVALRAPDPQKWHGAFLIGRVLRGCKTAAAPGTPWSPNQGVVRHDGVIVAALGERGQYNSPTDA